MKNTALASLIVICTGGATFADPVSQAAAQISGQTVHFHDDAHGNQIEYYSPDGALFLWYPGNRKTVVGEWKVQHSERCDVGSDGFLKCARTSDVEICYKYPSSSRNPVTKQRGGQFECEDYNSARSAAHSTREGDIFSLSKNNKVPFRLSKRYVTLDGLLQKFTGKK